MQVVVIAGLSTQTEFREKGVAPGIDLRFVTSVRQVPSQADVWFYLLPEEHIPGDLSEISDPHIPVFVHAVTTTSDLLPANCIRINAWPGFLQRSSVEVYYSNANEAVSLKVLSALGWKYQLVPDIPGLISARVIAMIINEAYFALGEEVSTKKDINVAMKLGTNYPLGPFEWAEKIGLRQVSTLLQVLAATDSRYAPATALTNEIS